ncbi:single-stranded DNA-binding protein [Halomicronema sp. CCY15110]|uniref:single-stranded DNA-binding protein n=1 Tax=Halomicronema sp. CCY15110 TaxID=2767773 RepID=UPI00194FA071|nr:single-stranded DNA-binding protein [Halomicronema sp. CCY15110]
MNHCLLMAEIISAPQLRYTQDNQTAIAEMTVAFPGLRDDDPAQPLKVIGWGNLAQEMQERYQVGERVLLEGRLAMNTVDRPEGFKEKRAEMTAQRVYRLTDLGTTVIGQPAPMPNADTPSPAAIAAPSPSAAQAAPTAAATPDAAADVDYDDIPF